MNLSGPRGALHWVHKIHPDVARACEALGRSNPWRSRGLAIHERRREWELLRAGAWWVHDADDAQREGTDDPT